MMSRVFHELGFLLTHCVNVHRPNLQSPGIAYDSLVTGCFFSHEWCEEWLYTHKTLCSSLYSSLLPCSFYIYFSLSLMFMGVHSASSFLMNLYLVFHFPKLPACLNILMFTRSQFPILCLQVRMLTSRLWMVIFELESSTGQNANILK